LLYVLVLVFIVAAFVGWGVSSWRDVNGRAEWARHAPERAAAVIKTRIMQRELNELGELHVRQRARAALALAPSEPLVRGTFAIDTHGTVEASDPVLREVIARELAPTVATNAHTQLYWHGVLLEAAPTPIAWRGDGARIEGFVIDNVAWTRELAELAGDAVVTVHLGGDGIFPMMNPPLSLDVAPNPAALARAEDDARWIIRAFQLCAGIAALLLAVAVFVALRAALRPRRRPIPTASIAQADAVVQRVLLRVEEPARSKRDKR
jgi:hypothetical protein